MTELPTVSVRLNEPLSPDQIEKLDKILAENALGVSRLAYWTQSIATLENTKKRVSRDCVLLKCVGDSRMISPQTFLYGDYPYAPDYNGCAISSSLADNLFGSTQVVGLPIMVDKSEYTICGVWDGQEQAMLIQQNPQSGLKLTNIELSFTGDQDGREVALAFARETQLTPVAIVNGPGIAMIAGLTCSLPLYMLGWFLLIQLLCCLLKLRENQMILLLLIMLCIFLLLGGKFTIPDYLIPTKWSDFSHWSRLLKNYQMRGIELLSLTPTIEDVKFRIDALKFFLNLFASFISVAVYLGICANPRFQFYNPSIRTICAVHTLFLVVALLLLRIISIPVRLCYIPIFYLIVRYYIFTGRMSLKYL